MKSALSTAVIILAAVGSFHAYAGEANPANVTLTRTWTGVYDVNEPIRLTVTITSDSGPTILALGLTEQLPDGWTFDNVVSSSAALPAIVNFEEDTNEVEFGWINIPGRPFTLTYQVSVGTTIQESVDLTGRVEYRLDGGPQFSDTVTTTFTAVIDPEPTNPLKEFFSFLGCAPQGATAGGVWGDAAVVSALLLGLIAMSAMRRREESADAIRARDDR